MEIASTATQRLKSTVWDGAEFVLLSTLADESRDQITRRVDDAIASVSSHEKFMGVVVLSNTFTVSGESRVVVLPTDSVQTNTTTNGRTIQSKSVPLLYSAVCHLVNLSVTSRTFEQVEQQSPELARALAGSGVHSYADLCMLFLQQSMAARQFLQARISATATTRTTTTTTTTPFFTLREPSKYETRGRGESLAGSWDTRSKQFSAEQDRLDQQIHELTQKITIATQSGAAAGAAGAAAELQKLTIVRARAVQKLQRLAVHADLDYTLCYQIAPDGLGSESVSVLTIPECIDNGQHKMFSALEYDTNSRTVQPFTRWLSALHQSQLEKQFSAYCLTSRGGGEEELYDSVYTQPFLQAYQHNSEALEIASDNVTQRHGVQTGLRVAYEIMQLYASTHPKVHPRQQVDPAVTARWVQTAAAGSRCDYQLVDTLFKEYAATAARVAASVDTTWKEDVVLSTGDAVPISSSSSSSSSSSVGGNNNSSKDVVAGEADTHGAYLDGSLDDGLGPAVTAVHVIWRECTTDAEAQHGVDWLLDMERQSRNNWQLPLDPQTSGHGSDAHNWMRECRLYSLHDIRTMFHKGKKELRPEIVSGVTTHMHLLWMITTEDAATGVWWWYNGVNRLLGFAIICQFLCMLETQYNHAMLQYVHGRRRQPPHTRTDKLIRFSNSIVKALVAACQPAN